MAPHTARFHHAFVSSSLLSVLVTSSYVVMSLLPMSWRAKWGGGEGGTRSNRRSMQRRDEKQTVG